MQTSQTNLKKLINKIRNIELAKGFEKCSDELLNKWEKIFTNCLIEVSKEKGKREAKQDLKKIKSEFKKVVALNSYLHNQIESINETKLFNGSSPSTFRDITDPSLATTPFIEHQGANIDFGSFKTSNPLSKQENFKENINVYMTKQDKDDHKIPYFGSEYKNKEFPDPPLVKDSPEGNSQFENLIMGSAVQNSESSSSNEIENIIISNNNSKNLIENSAQNQIPFLNMVKTSSEGQIESESVSNDNTNSENIEFQSYSNDNQNPVVYNNYLDKAKISSSLILENIHDFTSVPVIDNSSYENEQPDKRIDCSPITPMNLVEKLEDQNLKRVITPELLRRVSSSEFSDIHEGNLK